MSPTLNATHIGTATAILEINGVNFLTDPFFSPAGTSFPVGPFVLKVTDDPALQLNELPVIDAILLSHEDHPDNLDPPGRQLLDGRPVFTTMDGAKNLAPRPAVRGMKPWDEIKTTIAGRPFTIIATPTQHVPGDECTGFLVTAPDFGTGRDGLPNAIYFSGDTVYISELESIAERFHVCAAVLNLGNAHKPASVEAGEPAMQITMDGRDGARLFRALRADVLVPMHYESWGHFTQFGEELRRVFGEEGVGERVCWLKGGEKVMVL
ncbi:beta-lactamase superfamily domain-containing protein [Aspergillus carlsbadensis]|nr:beta-lactamase superfamily domain-containing protein [Aspergillus carlsbadensis]